eukprot:COSAG01_NODE_1982_length_8733_cov_7.552235_3_plen_1702_part_01
MHLCCQYDNCIVFAGTDMTTCCARIYAGFCIAAMLQADCEAAGACKWTDGTCLAKHPATDRHLANGTSPKEFTCAMATSEQFCNNIRQLGAVCKWQAGTCSETRDGNSACGRNKNSTHCSNQAQLAANVTQSCFWDGHACLNQCPINAHSSIWPQCIFNTTTQKADTVRTADGSPVKLPFAFPLYGQLFTDLTVKPEGVLQFEQCADSYYSAKADTWFTIERVPPVACANFARVRIQFPAINLNASCAINITGNQHGAVVEWKDAGYRAALMLMPTGHIVAEGTGLDLASTAGKLITISLSGDVGADKLVVTVPDLTRAVFIPRRRSQDEKTNGTLAPMPCVFASEVPNSPLNCSWSGEGPDLRRSCNLTTPCAAEAGLTPAGHITCELNRSWVGDGGCEQDVLVNVHNDTLGPGVEWEDFLFTSLDEYERAFSSHLSLVKDSDELQSMAGIVKLPFAIPLYGQLFTKMVVDANGRLLFSDCVNSSYSAAMGRWVPLSNCRNISVTLNFEAAMATTETVYGNINGVRINWVATNSSRRAKLMLMPTGHIVAEGTGLDLASTAGKLISISLSGDVGADKLVVTVPDLTRAVFIPRRRSQDEKTNGTLAPMPCVFASEVPNSPLNCSWSGEGPDLRRSCDLAPICRRGFDPSDDHAKAFAATGSIVCGTDRMWRNVNNTAGCESRRCAGKRGDIAHSDTKCNLTHVDTKCDFVCQTGYEPTGTHICQRQTDNIARFAGGSCVPTQCMEDTLFEPSWNVTNAATCHKWDPSDDVRRSGSCPPKTTSKCMGMIGDICHFSCRPRFSKIGTHRCGQMSDGVNRFHGGRCDELAGSRGCTRSSALNYDALAWDDDGSCIQSDGWWSAHTMGSGTPVKYPFEMQERAQQIGANTIEDCLATRTLQVIVTDPLDATIAWVNYTRCTDLNGANVKGSASTNSESCADINGSFSAGQWIDAKDTIATNSSPDTKIPFRTEAIAFVSGVIRSGRIVIRAAHDALGFGWRNSTLAITVNGTTTRSLLSSNTLFGTTEFEIVTGSTSCVACAPGMYKVADGMSTCQACQPGLASNISGSSDSNDCILCPVGSFASSSGRTQCVSCGPGSVTDTLSEKGATMCSPCQAGKFSGSSSIPCANCTAGRYSQTGAVECMLCQAGQHSSSGSAQCTDCIAGRTDDDEDPATECRECDGRSYSDQPKHSGPCYTCAAGQEYISSHIICTSCSPGRFSLNGSSCAECLPGQFAYEIRSASCGACTAGKHSPGYGSTACKSCQAGRYSVDQSLKPECTNCTVGMYAHPLSDRDQRVSASAACKRCGAGKYLDVTGSSKDDGSDCKPCPPGRYGPNAGAGQISDCIACPAGTSANMSGRRSSMDCRNCTAGRWQSSTGSVRCSSCLPGKFSIDIRSTTNASCLLCSPGRYTIVPGRSSCVACTAGRASNVTGSYNASDCASCTSGSYSAEGASTCGKAVQAALQLNLDVGQVGEVGSSSRVQFEDALLRALAQTLNISVSRIHIAGIAAGSVIVTFVVLPDMQTGSAIDPAHVTSQISSGAAIAIDVNGSNLSLSPSLQGPIKTECYGGTYAIVDVSSIGIQCAECPKGQAVAQSGSTSVHDCQLCISGRFANQTGSTECELCSKGTASANLANTDPSNCTACSAGLYADADGSAHCTPCLIGSITEIGAGTGVVSSGATTCTACGSGTYSASSTVACATCAAG